MENKERAVTFGNVFVYKKFDRKPHNDPNYTCFLLEATEIVFKDAKSLALNKGISRKRVCIEYLHNSVAEKLKLKEGDNITEKYISLGGDYANIYSKGARIISREITQGEYDKLTPKKKLAWSPKSIPANKNNPEIPLYSKETGERIYHRREYVTFGSKYWEDVIIPCNSKLEIA